MQNRVREFREKEGLSQFELSRKTKICGPNLSDIELGKRLAWGKARRVLSKVLKMPEDVLFPEDVANGK